MMKAIISLLLSGLVLLAGSSSRGQTWTQISTNASYDWDGIAVSADGTKLAATVGSAPGEGIYVSTNSGASWSQTVSSNDWGSIASSADGTRLAVVNLDDSIYTSTNAGVTWNPASSPQNRWSSLASSADGSVLLAAATGIPGTFPLYSSTNYGATWVTNNVPQEKWTALACSADGHTLVAAAASGGIWMLQTPPSPHLNLSSSNGELNFSWIVPSTNMVLEQSTDIVNWTTLTNCPSLDLTTLEEQLTIQPTGSGDFFRLVSQ